LNHFESQFDKFQFIYIVLMHNLFVYLFIIYTKCWVQPNEPRSLGHFFMISFHDFGRIKAIFFEVLGKCHFHPKPTHPSPFQIKQWKCPQHIHFPHLMIIHIVTTSITRPNNTIFFLVANGREIK